MNNIQITIKLSDDLHNKLDALIAAIAGGVLVAPQKDETEPAKEIDQPAEKTPETESQAAPWDKDKPEPTPLPTPEPEPEPEPAQTVDKADVQKKVVELSAAGKKAEVRDIVKSYAERVSAIPEDKLAEVMAKLEALEG